MRSTSSIYFDLYLYVSMGQTRVAAGRESITGPLDESRIDSGAELSV